MKFVDPKNDIAFRKIFGDENKKEILISFLNNLLNFAGTTKEIIDLFLNGHYQDSKLEKLRQTTLTVNVLDKRNIRYIIEILIIHTEALEKRVMYYVSKAYSQQLNRAEDYPKLNQVIFLGFLDFVLFKENASYTTRHLILEESTNGHYFKDFDLNFVELPKFEKSLKELSDVKEKWIYFVKNAGDLTIIPKEMEEPKEIREAFEVANQLSWTKEELDAYDKKGIYIQDERGRIEFAKEEGKMEKALEIAKSMLNKGISIDIIAETTGLAKEEIEKEK